MSRPRFGYNEAPGALTPASIATAKAGGAQVLRLPVDIDVVLSQGFARYDAIVTEAKRQGVKILPVLAGTNGKTKVGAVKRTARAIAKRYGKALEGIEVWNEPNFIGAMPAGKYARMLRKSAKAVHSARPKLDVISAGPSPSVAGAQEYQRKVLRKTRKSNITVGVHLYPRKNDPVKQAMAAIKRAYNQSGGKNVYVTEAGIGADRYGDRQAELSAKLLRALDRQKAVKGTIFHRLAQPADGSFLSDWENRNRLWAVDSQGNPTDLYRALARTRAGKRKK